MQPLAMVRSGSCISAIFASTSLSPSALSCLARASAFSSLARSFIAARSSSVKPLDFCVSFLVVLLPWLMRISFHLFELVCRKTPW